MPQLDLDGFDWGWDEVFGVGAQPLHARLELHGVDSSIDHLCVSVRRLSDDLNVDFPCESSLSGADPGITVEQSFLADDYSVFAALQLADASDHEWKSGFRRIFTVLPSENDVIRDNDAPIGDGGVVYFQSSANLSKERVDGYMYGAFVTDGNTLDWAQWYPHISGPYEIWAFVGGGGQGLGSFVIYPDPSFSMVSDDVDFGGNPYKWKRLTRESGLQTIFEFTEEGYVGLAAEGGANARYLFDAVKFVRNVVGIDEIAGSTADTDTFIEAYERYGGPEALGYPVDHNGGGEYVHWWSNSASGMTEGVWIQDLQRTTADAPWPDGRTALILNEILDEVYLLEKGFWLYYMNHQGYANLGFPWSDEYMEAGITYQDFTHGKLAWDPNRPGDGITHLADGGILVPLHEVDFISSASGVTVWNEGNLVGHVPASMDGCESCTYLLEIEVPGGSGLRESSTQVEYELTVGTGPMTVDLDDILQTGVPSGSITAPTGSQVGDVTVSVTVSDPDGVERVAVLFPSGGELPLCGAGAPSACTGVDGDYARGNVNPANHGASLGAVTIRLFVEDTLGNNVEVADRTFSWQPDLPPVGLSLTVMRQGDGEGTISSTSGTVQCGPGCSSQTVTIPEGTSVTLNGEPEPGFLFLGFAGDRCYGIDDCTFTMISDLTVRATFGTPDTFRAISGDPGEGDTGVATSSNVRVTFNREIALGPNQGDIAFTDCGGTAFPMHPPAVQSSERRLILIPIGDLDEDTCYEVLIPAGAVEDLGGVPLPDPFGFSFTTGSLGVPQIYVAAFPRKIQEGDETTVTVWSDRAQPFDRTVTLSSSNGQLFHPSQVTVPADEISVDLQVDTRRDHGDHVDNSDTLIVAEPASGTASVALEIINFSNIPGSDFRVLAFSMIDDDNHNGIFEADEDARFLVEVWNGSSTPVFQTRIDFSIPNASTFDVWMRDEDCNFGTLQAWESDSCEVDVRTDDEAPPGEYWIRLDGSSSSGFEFLDYFDFDLVNNALPNYRVIQNTGGSPIVEPGDTLLRQYGARMVGDGFELHLPTVQLLLQDPNVGGEDVVIGETLTNVRHEEGNEETLTFSIVAPAVPGVYPIRAYINPPPNQIPETNFGDNESVVFNLTVQGPNEPPVLDPVGGPFAVNAGETLGFTALANDPNGDGLTFSLANAPAGAAIHPTTGVFSWTPADSHGPQTYFFDVVVSDGELEDRETIQVTVNRSADLGVSKSVDLSAAAPGQSVVFTVVVTNHGPGGVQGGTVDDPIPVGLDGVTWFCSAVGGSCTAAGSGALVDSNLALDRDGVATYTIQASLALDAPANVLNTATVSVPSPIADPNPGNDQASVSVSRRDLDFGDAPDASLGTGRSFPTRTVDNGARHGIEPALVLGITIDGEGDGQPSDAAAGDDTTGADDESGVVFLTPMAPCETVDIEVTSSMAGMLDAWVDFSGDGDWGDLNEQVFASQGLMAGVNPLSFAVPCGALPADQVHLRFRLSSTGGLSYAGLALDGEVEDYATPILGFDHGDAPASYPSLRADDGARHLLPIGGPILGSRADAETDGLPDADAAGDDQDGTPDDEDGIVFVGALIPGNHATLAVTASAPAKLDAWIDFNNDGDWVDAGEQIFNSEQVPVAGTNLLSFELPATVPAGLNTFGRFRLSRAGGLSITGAAPDGEVEDHPVTISETADLTLTQSDSVDPTLAGSALTYTVSVTNQGPLDAPDVVVTDTLPAGVSFVTTSGCIEDPDGIPACSLGTIQAGGSKQYTLTVVPSSSGAIVNSACVASGVPDASPGDECADETTVIEESADLALAKSGDQDPVAPGDSLTYTIGVSNLGPSDSTGGQVTDTLPDGLTYADSPDGCSAVQNVVTCDFGPILASEAIDLSFAVTVDLSAVGPISNTATVVGNENDPVASNNTATEDTTLVPPRVSFVGSVEDSGDGLLSDGEVTSVAISELRVVFERPMNDPAGHTEVGDVTNPASYLLFSDGGDGFDTQGCATGIDLADLAIALDTPIYDIGTFTVALPLAGASLTDGSYRLLVCGSLLDAGGSPLDGNADGTAGDDFARTFTVDAKPPRVTAIGSEPGTGDGQLAEGEATNLELTALLVSFDEGVFDPPGDSEADDITNPVNHLLFSDGGDGFDTTDCSTGVDAGDVAVAIDGVAYDAGQRIATLTLDGGSPLAAGRYRLLVCGTTSVIDLAGSPLDGDGDGSGGDDFVRSFIVDQTDPVDPSAASTTHLPGTWSNQATVAVEWSGASDAGGGVWGYSYLFDNIPTTLPDAVIDLGHGSDPHGASSGPLADGADHFFHLRTCDGAANCTQTVHLGPFQIDTAPPTPPANLISPSHQVGVPASDATIEVNWDPVVDTLSGTDGYAYAFDASSGWTCDQSQDLEETATGITSPPLAEGNWTFHICAVDLAGNWSEVANAGPFVIDGAPPTVIHVTSVAGTRDGELSPGERTPNSVTQLYVTFSEPVRDPAGDSDPDDVTNPENYALFSQGGDGVFNTVDCAGGIDPADTPIAVDEVFYDGALNRAMVRVNGGSPLVFGVYRLLVCGTTSIADEAGIALDGNADGTGGDDFAVDFRVEVTNLLANPNFDDGLAAWDLLSPQGNEINHSTLDADQAPTSGSVEIVTFSGAGGLFSVSQCVEIGAGEWYWAVGRPRVASGSAGDPLVSIQVEFFAQAACGDQVQPAVAAVVQGDTGEAWLEDFDGWVVAPADSMSARVSFAVDAATSFDANFDSLLFYELTVVFEDGFESGDTSEWASATP
ncbi:MAG: DUF11 domain-containing protein [bacterium]|nr:DUF11 domain-containing protein [bacterium]